jgi:hypothetical protein
MSLRRSPVFLAAPLLLAACGAKANNAIHDHEPGARGDECPLGQIVCDDACTDPATDADHCGGCDTSCDGESCRNGVCGGGRSCPEAMVDCDDECRDISGDPEYCGGCDGYLCGAKESCWNGVCTCRPELTPCSEAGCLDTLSSAASCGNCDRACAEGEVCQRGECVTECAGAFTRCGGGCVDTEFNPLHCGGCGRDCAQDQYCLSGHCVDYEPAVHCAGSCNGCNCPEDEKCCDLPGYGVSCVDTRLECPEPPTGR